MLMSDLAAARVLARRTAREYRALDPAELTERERTKLQRVLDLCDTVVRLADALEAAGRDSRPARGRPHPLGELTMPARRLSRLEVKALHAAGLPDKEIAARLGCHRSAVRAIRLLLKLPTNDTRYRGWTGREEKELERLLMAGERYDAIAARLGRSYASVSQKAMKLDLVGEGRGRPTPTATLVRAWGLFARGWSTPAVADEVGVHRATALKYRKRMPAGWATDEKREDAR